MSNALVGSLVSVYGSLRAGLGNHRLLSTAVRQDDGIIADGFRMVSLGGFPALIKQGEHTPIVVEVYEVENETRASNLDMLEGYPSFYDREVVTLVDGRECWVYFIRGNSYSDNTPVPNGDWKQFKLS